MGRFAARDQVGPLESSQGDLVPGGLADQDAVEVADNRRRSRALVADVIASPPEGVA
jgi:hypothetical protein